MLQQLQSVFQDNSGSGSARTRRSAFKRWSPTDPMAVLRSSPKFQQHLLKAALFTVPRAHATKKEEVQIQYSNEAETSAQLYSGMRSFRGGPYSSGGSSISAHARNERNRRQKLHDRFMTLRSLVPNITKVVKSLKKTHKIIYQLASSFSQISDHVLRCRCSQTKCRCSETPSCTSKTFIGG